MVFKLSTSNVIVSQKGSNGDGKLHFFELDFNVLDKKNRVLETTTTNKHCKYYCVVLSSFGQTDHLTILSVMKEGVMRRIL